MIRTQIVIKTLLVGVIALLITSCTKDDFTPPENNGVWQKVNIRTSVEEGQEASISTKQIGELDPVLGVPLSSLSGQSRSVYTQTYMERR